MSSEGKGTTDEAASSILLLVELLLHFHFPPGSLVLGNLLPLAPPTLLSRWEPRSICLHLAAQPGKQHRLCTGVKCVLSASTQLHRYYHRYHPWGKPGTTANLANGLLPLPSSLYPTVFCVSFYTLSLMHI